MTAPDGWPLWVSPVPPGREHDVTCTRIHPGLLDALGRGAAPVHRHPGRIENAQVAVYLT